MTILTIPTDCLSPLPLLRGFRVVFFCIFLANLSGNRRTHKSKSEVFCNRRSWPGVSFLHLAIPSVLGLHIGLSFMVHRAPHTLP
ncbi:hypothetical protein GDO78_015424 [Eleutherodactylus coqui]|uniref:Uncharacterized protein n=1 Tax=Eleutherodactylus coqui TaxID=57060 RepID=A0A8J6EDT7_ELECQ|nr:hypothetical protein GDO78_015424 [Eleutherodactylus coqui]